MLAHRASVKPGDLGAVRVVGEEPSLIANAARHGHGARRSAVRRPEPGRPLRHVRRHVARAVDAARLEQRHEPRVHERRVGVQPQAARHICGDREFDAGRRLRASLDADVEVVRVARDDVVLLDLEDRGRGVDAASGERALDAALPDAPVVRSNAAFACEISRMVATGATADVYWPNNCVRGQRRPRRRRATTPDRKARAKLNTTPVLRSFTVRSMSTRSWRTPPTSVTRGATENASSANTDTSAMSESKSVRLPAPGKFAAVSPAGNVAAHGR